MNPKEKQENSPRTRPHYDPSPRHKTLYCSSLPKYPTTMSTTPQTQKNNLSFKGKWRGTLWLSNNHLPNEQTKNQTPERNHSTQISQMSTPKEGDLGFPPPSRRGYNKKALLTKASFSKAYPSCSHDEAKLTTCTFFGFLSSIKLQRLTRQQERDSIKSRRMT